MTTPTNKPHPHPCPLGRLGDDGWNDATAATLRAAGREVECTCHVPRAVLAMRSLVGRLELQEADGFDLTPERPVAAEARAVLAEVEKLAAAPPCPAASEATDPAKRLAEIEAKHALVADHGYPLDATQWHQDRSFLLAEVRRLSRPAPTDLADIRERAAAPEVTWSMGLDRQDRLALLRVIDEAHAALDALGVAPGSLAERVRALGEEHRKASGALTAYGIPADGSTLNVRIQLLSEKGSEYDPDRLTPSERAGLEAQATPATRDFLAAMREMRRTGDTAAGLEAFQSFLVETMPRAATPPPEPDLEPAAGD